MTSPAMGRIRAAMDRVTARLALVGADPNDDEDLRARKALLVLISVLILPVSCAVGSAVSRVRIAGRMVAAGVPTPRHDHAPALALLALDMVEAMRSTEGVGRFGLELRVGINSGPVVAGVIGRKRFLYDL